MVELECTAEAVLHPDKTASNSHAQTWIAITTNEINEMRIISA